MKHYDYYYFDFDGTLVDTWKSLIRPFQVAYGHFGYQLTPSDVLHFTHMAMVQSCLEVGITKEEDMLTLYQILSEEMKSEEDLKKIEVFPEVSEVLGALKKNDKKIAVVSGNSVTHIGRVLKIIGLDQYFDFYVGGDSTKNPKPFADPLLKAMELSGNPLKETCLYIGDSLQDPECAKNAGIDGFLLDRKNEYAKEKWPIIHNLKELLND